MMFWLLFVALLFVSPAHAGLPDFHLENGLATDQTLELIYELEHFQQYPNLPRFYFSESTAGGVLPAGDDANPCTKQKPCRTVDKMEALLNRGLVHIILDEDDDWDLLVDWTAGGGDGGVAIIEPPACAGIGSDRICFVISSTSFSPDNRTRFDCTLNPGTVDEQSMFGLAADREVYGWGAIENFEFNNCPPSTVPAWDILRARNDYASGWIALNLKSVDGVKGGEEIVGPAAQRNEFLAGGEESAMIVSLNTEAFIQDAGVGYSAQLLDFSEGSAILVGTSELYGLDTDTGASPLTSLIGSDNGGNNTDGIEIVVVGHYIREHGTAANPYQGITVETARVDTSMFIADVVVDGFQGAVSSIDLGLTSGLSTIEHDLTGTIYRTSVVDGQNHVYGISNESNNYSMNARCMLHAEVDADDVLYYKGSGFNTPLESQVSYTVTGVREEDPTADRYQFFGDIGTPLLYETAGDANEAHTGLSIFEGSSVESGGPSVVGDVLGGLDAQRACDSADCYALCDEDITYSFTQGAVPSLVLGSPWSGFHLGGQRSFGGR